MFDELSLNRLLRVAYPTVVFLFTVLAWNNSGQLNAIDFQGFPKVPDPSWPTPGSIQPSCDADRLAIQTGAACRIEVEQPKMQVEASRSSSYPR
jgi:hypothetical protein